MNQQTCSIFHWNLFFTCQPYFASHVLPTRLSARLNANNTLIIVISFWVTNMFVTAIQSRDRISLGGTHFLLLYGLAIFPSQWFEYIDRIVYNFRARSLQRFAVANLQSGDPEDWKLEVFLFIWWTSDIFSDLWRFRPHELLYLSTGRYLFYLISFKQPIFTLGTGLESADNGISQSRDEHVTNKGLFLDTSDVKKLGAIRYIKRNS